MSDKIDYKPEAEVVEALARPVIDEKPTQEIIPEIAGHTPTLCPQQTITVTSSENKELAVKHIRNTLDSLEHLLNDLNKLAPASQKGFMYQTAAMIAKTLLDGSHMLHALDASEQKPKETRGGATSNHLHLNLTSAQMAELVEAQIKKNKNGE